MNIILKCILKLHIPICTFQRFIWSRIDDSNKNNIFTNYSKHLSLENYNI